MAKKKLGNPEDMDMTKADDIVESQQGSSEVTKFPSIKDVEDAKPETPVSGAAAFLGTKLEHGVGGRTKKDKERDQQTIDEVGLTRVGENLKSKAEIREGWIPVDRALLGDRDIFYPESWSFKIRPATVETIRKWSTIDDENPIVVDEVFTEVLQYCLMINDGTRLIPYGNLNSWDRFFFIMLIREYTFIDGEQKIQYTEDCPECDNPVTFELNSQALMYDMPDESVMKYYDRETRTWNIDPQDFGLEDEDIITLYIPTIERDANIRNWMVSRLRDNKKVDQVFLRFLPWMTQKIQKDATIATKTIRSCEMKYKSWNTDMFSFMDDVIRNVIVNPIQSLTAQCPTCGEEVTTQIRFQDGISSLFNVQNKFRKFGKK